jgi:hypothetical protein
MRVMKNRTDGLRYDIFTMMETYSSNPQSQPVEHIHETYCPMKKSLFVWHKQINFMDQSVDESISSSLQR